MANNTTTTGAVGIKDVWMSTAVTGFHSATSFLQAAAVQNGDGATQKGNTVDFYIYGRGTPSIAELTEDSDGTSSTLVQTVKAVTLKEYGDFWRITQKLSMTTFNKPEIQAAWNAGVDAAEALDKLARAALDAETGAAYNTYTGGGASIDEVLQASNHFMTGAQVRMAAAKLASANVEPFDGQYFLAHIHPAVLKDLKDETGNASWVVKELYTGERAKPIRNEVGVYEGFRFIQTTQANVQTNASATTDTVYTTYFHGADAFGVGLPENVNEMFSLKVSPPVVSAADVFGRFTHVGWYSLSGFTALKPAALHKVFSCSTLND